MSSIEKEIFDFLNYGFYEIKTEWIDKKTEGLVDNEKETITINLVLLNNQNIFA